MHCIWLRAAPTANLIVDRKLSQSLLINQTKKHPSYSVFEQFVELLGHFFQNKLFKIIFGALFYMYILLILGY